MVLDYMKLIFKSGGQIPKEQALEEVVELWKFNASPLHEFLEAETDRDISTAIPKDEFFKALLEWADSIPDIEERKKIQQRIPKTSTSLTLKMKTEGIDTRRLGSKKQQEWKYAGIKWKRESRFNPVKTIDGHL